MCGVDTGYGSSSVVIGRIEREREIEWDTGDLVGWASGTVLYCGECGGYGVESTIASIEPSNGSYKIASGLEIETKKIGTKEEWVSGRAWPWLRAFGGTVGSSVGRIDYRREMCAEGDWALRTREWEAHNSLMERGRISREEKMWRRGRLVLHQRVRVCKEWFIYRELIALRKWQALSQGWVSVKNPSLQSACSLIESALGVKRHILHSACPTQYH